MAPAPLAGLEPRSAEGLVHFGSAVTVATGRSGISRVPSSWRRFTARLSSVQRKRVHRNRSVCLRSRRSFYNLFICDGIEDFGQRKPFLFASDEATKHCEWAISKKPTNNIFSSLHSLFVMLARRHCSPPQTPPRHRSTGLEWLELLLPFQ
ncbi:unnamed protein product [Protopolystoma xenopodis]|uniref:Uncharacterized protein n=1 Tax=Protopolystoma xenopodis TaxID=117903 RepID=A0A3S4ZCU0_9PLAT|nr:unnamed protein product [Protopolystoma xenopodis]